MKIGHLAILMWAFLAIVGCTSPKEGPAERAGRSIDNVVEDSADAIEDAGDEVERSVARSRR